MTGPMSGPADGRPRSGLVLIAAGTICGIAWAAGFRSYMSELAGTDSQIDWAGTFAAILLPGAVTGGLLGWAEHLRRTGGRPRWRWLALAPLAFAVAPMLMPGALVQFLTQGLGGGAVAVAAIALGCGYSVSGRGPRWARLVTGVAGVALLAALTLATPAIGGARLALSEPRGAWVAVLVASFVVVLALASAIPHLPVVRRSIEPG
ncbi:hypothetical protein AB0B45_36890 [Nonomuraea sp. NPDC049152]|uniref:hypothetical protein n=1 Tax=Nonomuraea sp. NPDC049152 TaxID=3154350 RepID=UPI0033E670FC